jgi:hypothetical protein
MIVNKAVGYNQGETMKIRAGFTLGYECPQPTAMLLVGTATGAVRRAPKAAVR